MKKIGLFLFSLLIIGSLIIGGCTSSSPTITNTVTQTNTVTNTLTTNSPESKPFEGVTIRFLTNGHEIGIEDLLPIFEEETGIKVEIDVVDMTSLYTKLDVEFGAGNASFDVAEMMWAAAQGYMRGGHLIELDDYIEKYDVDVNQYAAVYVNNHMIQYPQTEDGAYICLPHQADIQILAYRADLFEDPTEQSNFMTEYGYELAPPENYEQFIDIAEFFTRDTDGDGENDLFGTVVMGGNFPSLVGDVTSYLRAHGGDWIGDDFHPVINSAESIEGLQFYYDLWANSLTPPAANTYIWDEENADFQNGKIAMMQIWPGQVAGLENPEASSVAGKLKYSVVPGKYPTVGGWAVAIPKYTDNPEAAFVFANWLTSPEIALARARATGFSTAAAAVYTDPVMAEQFKYLDAFNESLNYGEGWPQIGEFTSIWQIGAEEYSRVFAGELTIQQAADNMQQRLDQLMSDGGYYE